LLLGLDKYLSKAVVRLLKYDHIKYNISVGNHRGITALHWAALLGHLDVVRELLKHNPDRQIVAKCIDEMIPLYIACHFETATIVNEVYDLNLDLEPRSNIDVIKELLNHNPVMQLACITNDGKSCLYAASSHEHHVLSPDYEFAHSIELLKHGAGLLESPPVFIWVDERNAKLEGQDAIVVALENNAVSLKRCSTLWTTIYSKLPRPLDKLYSIIEDKANQYLQVVRVWAENTATNIKVLSEVITNQQLQPVNSPAASAKALKELYEIISIINFHYILPIELLIKMNTIKASQVTKVPVDKIEEAKFPSRDCQMTPFFQNEIDKLSNMIFGLSLDENQASPSNHCPCTIL
jgi:hypothetical protein